MHACMHASMHACMYVMYVMYMYVYNASAHVSIQFVCSCLNISKFRKTYLYNIVVGFLCMHYDYDKNFSMTTCMGDPGFFPTQLTLPLQARM